MIVYRITNKITGKMYIGQTTTSLSQRWRSHCCYDKCKYLHASINKYGKQNFSIEEIRSYNNLKDLNNAEQYYIDFYNTIAPNGYNLRSGGNNSLHSEESKQRMKEAAKTNPTVFKKGHSINKGIVRSEDYCKKLGERKKSPENIENLRRIAPKKGESRSPTTQFQKGGIAPLKGRKKQIIDGKIRFLKVQDAN